MKHVIFSLVLGLLITWTIAFIYHVLPHSPNAWYTIPRIYTEVGAFISCGGYFIYAVEKL